MSVSMGEITMFHATLNVQTVDGQKRVSVMMMMAKILDVETK